MPVPVRETLKFFFNGGTVTRAHTITVPSREEGEEVVVIMNDLVRVIVRASDMALYHGVHGFQVVELVKVAKPLNLLI